MSRKHSAGKRCLAIFLSFAIGLSLLMSLASCGPKEETTELVIGVTEKNRDAVAALADDFNGKNPAVTVKLRVYGSEAEKNYYLSHGADDCDMYTFEEAVAANSYRDILHPLDRYNSTKRYMVSVINCLRATDGNIYVLPADGIFYTQGYNTGVLAELGFSVPTTLSELKLLASRLKYTMAASETSSSASVGGRDSVLFALMSVAYPMFLNTVTGANALNGLATGTVDFLDAAYVSNWQNIFENLQVLYDEKFLSLDDLDKYPTYGIHRFNGETVVSIQGSAATVGGGQISPSLSVKYAPFVGEEGRDACFGSMPAFYLAASAQSAENSEKSAAMTLFLNYFATSDAQKLSRTTAGNMYISYLKSAAAELPAEYAELRKLASEGKMFVTDAFYYTFGECTDDMIAFLSHQINIDRMLYNIDQKLKEKRDSESFSIAQIRTPYLFEEGRVYTEDTALGTFFANAFTYADYVDGVLLPSSMLRCSLLEGTLTEGELAAIFEERELAFANVTAATFLTLYEKIGEKSHPLTARLTVKDGVVYDGAGQALGEGQRLVVILPASLAEDLGADAEIGSTFSSTTRLTEYFRHYYKE